MCFDIIFIKYVLPCLDFLHLIIDEIISVSIMQQVITFLTYKLNVILFIK